MVWFGMVCYAMVWYSFVLCWFGMVCDAMVWQGMLWCAMLWYGLVWPPIPAFVDNMLDFDKLPRGVCRKLLPILLVFD